MVYLLESRHGVYLGEGLPQVSAAGQGTQV